MIFWHFLTKSRLEEKLAHARSHGGQLLLHAPEISKDITKGVLSNYIYCLPSILSGMNFGDSDVELCLLRIQLHENAKGYFVNPQPPTHFLFCDVI